ncbi:hypothetical protein QYF61_022118 [Mycteria americana]|uniref:ribonuclease H n=1 Tax=Mycteria americana TaxID=33587 RepID=A0AAN7NGW6_MYCAM|nr:hypothetical protein QYF61_022118 [Mycteria americana]
MGGQQSGGIVKKSPLGCILAHWKEIGGPPGGSVNKKTLIKYCDQWWPLYKLEDGEKWPLNGTLKYNTLLQLMLFLWREGKWDEVVYADMFFTLRNHPEWQKECGINLAPQDPMVLAIEKERNKQNRILKRCCSACSIGQRCLKKGKVIEKEMRVLLGEKSRRRERERNWRLTAGNYRDDPERVAKGFELIVKTQDPDWEDVDAMLDAVFSESEKQMVVRAARTQVQALVLAGTLPGTVDNHVPITNPGWDPNQMGTRNLLGMDCVRNKKCCPKISKLVYTPLDPTSQEGKSQLIVLFLGQLVDDIRRKLQKVQGADARDLERLLETAWQVYRNRDSRKEKQMGKTIANATVAALRTVEGQIPPRSNSNEGRGVMRSGASAPLRGKRGNQPLLRDQCLGKEEKKPVEFLIDTGATFSVLNQTLLPVSKQTVNIVGATGQVERAFFLRPLKFKIGKSVGIHKSLYLPEAPRPLLGRDLLEQLNAEIRFKDGEIEFKIPEENHIEILSLALTEPQVREEEIMQEIKDQVYPGVWASGIPGKAKNAELVVVKLKEGARPIRYNTPILPDKKPDGKTYRLVQDLRAINRIVEDLHPVVANPYTLLTSLKETYEWFTVLDLKDAFFCLTLAPESRNFFAFEWENPDSGWKTQLTWTVLPQGFKNSPTIFGNQLSKELEVWERPPGNGTLLQYVDDILIATEKEEECKEWTVSLLNFLGLSGYRVSLQKVQILKKEVIYLGFVISKGQRQLGNDRKEAICRTPEPTTVKELRTFLGMTGWCRLWIYNYGLLVKPLYELLKNSQTQLTWTDKAKRAFKELKLELMRAPALGLPDITKPFWLFSYERQGVALGILAQRLGPYKRAVAYFSKQLDEVSKGWPGCLRAVAAVVLIIQEARKFTLGQKMVVHTSHAVTSVLEQKGGHGLSPSRFLKYQAVLMEQDDIEIVTSAVINPASFLSNKQEMKTAVHDCIETIETVYTSRPDLKDEPLEEADHTRYTDGSSFVKNGVRMAGYAVTTTDQVVEAKSLPKGTSAQRAEIVALVRALELAKGLRVNIWTDSKYAFGVVHAHGAIWKERGLLTAQGKGIKHADIIL